MADRKLIVKIIGDSSSLERAFGRASSSGNAFNTGLKRTGLAIGALAAGFAGLGVAAGKAAADFQESMQKVVGLSGVAQGKIAGLSDEVLKLAPRVGRGPQELADALFFITSSGIDAAHSIDVLTNSAKASVAGLGETKTVADAVTSAMNAYGVANLSAKQATDVLVATVREGKGEAAAFAGVIGNVASLASQLGISFNDVGAALAAETRLGIDAETASVQLQQVFSNLVKVAPQAEKAFRSVGLSSAGLRKELSDKGLLATLETIKTAFADNLPALAKAFPNIRALRGVLALVGNQADKTAEIFGRMKDSSDALGTAFGAVSQDTAQQFRKMQAAAQVAKIRIGAAFAPLAGLVARGLTSATDALTTFFDRLGEAHTFTAKVDVAIASARDVAGKLEKAVGDAVAAVDWDKVWARARGLADGFQKRLDEIDFGAVGTKIGDAFADAVKVAIPAAKELAQRISDVVGSIDFVKLGKAAGPGLAAAIATAFVTLLDPAFWAKNWDLALAVALSVGGGKFLRLGGKLLAPLIGPFLRVGARLGSALETGLLRGAEAIGPKLGGIFLGAADLIGKAFARIPGLVGRAFAPITGLVSRVFDRLTGVVDGKVSLLGRLARFTIKVLGIQAVIDAVVGLAQKVGAVFGHLGGVIGNALDAAWEKLKEGALKAALAIVEPFSHIPGFLGGGTFQDLKKKWQATLDAMNLKTKTATDGIQKSIDEIHGKTVTITVKAPPGLQGPIGTVSQAPDVRPPGGIVRGPTAVKPPAPETTPRLRQGITAAQRNKFFDDAIRRQEDRVQDISSLTGQLSALQKIGALLQARLKATKDVTRRLKLEDDILENQRAQKGVRRQIAQDFSDSLTLGLTKALATAGFKDDLAALKKINDNIRKQIKETGTTVELQNQLFENEQQIAQTRHDQRSARQFKALGLGPTGDAIIPGVGNLKKQSASLLARLQASGGLTPKLKALFEGVGKVLSGSLGKVTKDTRAKIAELFDTIRQGFDKGTAPLTKTTSLAGKVGQAFEGLGLSRDQMKQLSSRFAGFNSAGVGLAGRSVALAGGPPIVINNTLTLDGHVVSRNQSRINDKRKGRNAMGRRGHR